MRQGRRLVNVLTALALVPSLLSTAAWAVSEEEEYREYHAYNDSWTTEVAMEHTPVTDSVAAWGESAAGGFYFDDGSGQIYGEQTQREDLKVAEEEILTVPGTIVGAEYTTEGGLALEGSGTPIDPYEITSAGDLAAFRDAVNGGYSFSGEYIELTQDIDLQAAGYDTWEPIGEYVYRSTSYPFSGTFDGGGHTISGLHVEQSSGYAGLFGYTSGATIQDLGVSGSVSSSGSSGSSESSVGGIVGLAYTGSQILRCYSSCTVTYTSSGFSYAGGIAGLLDRGSSVTDCYNTGPVSGNERVGGIVGVVGPSDNSVTNCYNTGAVSGSSNVGGIVGYLNNRSSMTNCYNTGSVSGNNYVGGIAGVVNGGENYATNCYNTGAVSGDSNVGGIAGYSGANGVTNCYSLTGCVTAGSGGNNGTPTTQFANAGTFTDWDFTTTWEIDPFLGRPVLRAVPEDDGVAGDGTSPETAYQIATAEDLAAFRDSVNYGNSFSGQYIELVNDIDLEDAAWDPIGKYVAYEDAGNAPFSGTFDGGGHTISGLHVEQSSGYAGLFGYTSGATIQDLGVFGSVSGSGSDGCVGGIVGLAYGSDIARCSSSCTVTNTGGSYTGGIVGNLAILSVSIPSSITDCYNTGAVSGSSDVGGITGQVGSWNTATNCYNIGAVSGSSDVGGIAGVDGSPGNAITNCYYLDTRVTNGNDIGTSKTAAQFASGEVARLLADGQSAGTQVWGQRLTGGSRDDSPVLTNSRALSVLQVTFKVNASDTTAYDTAYTNPDGTVALPESDPTPPDGQVFAGWRTATGGAFDGTTPVTADLTVTAVFSDEEDPGTPETPITPPTGGDTGGSTGGSSGGSDSEPSYSPVQDVGEGGSLRVSPRTAEEGDTVTLTPTPDEGFEVESVTVTGRNGREVDVTDNGDGTYTFTQPAGRVTISVTFREIAQALPFTDVPENYWAHDEIAWAYENGYMTGTTATTFTPGGTVSRQQVWMILARLDDYNPADMAAARAWAMSTGVSDGTNPGGAVTRQQLAALLHRFAAAQGYDVSQRADLSAYPDAGSVAAYAVEPMEWAVGSGIITGTTAGILDPQGTATRAQLAVMLQRFLA